MKRESLNISKSQVKRLALFNYQNFTMLKKCEVLIVILFFFSVGSVYAQTPSTPTITFDNTSYYFDHTFQLTVTDPSLISNPPTTISANIDPGTGSKVLLHLI